MEKALFKSGRRIGDGPGDVSVAGVGFGDLLLSVGHGYMFKTTMLDAVTTAMVDSLLAPLLLGEPIATPVVRLRPELAPVASLEMFD